MKYLLSFILLFTSLTLLGKSVHKPKGVNWYQGTVEEAMKLAKKENRPMFLYWGAVWCPPCNQIKKTIFSKKEFHKESEKFISIYLDGDQPNAQKWGDHFGTVGYPTMMILNSLGKEMTRMPTGLKVSQYVDLMGKTRLNMVPLEEVLRKGLIGKGSVEDYERLAGYSWGQDQKFKESYLSKEEKEKTFTTLYQKAPASPGHLKAHFFLRSLIEKSKKKTKGSKEELQYFLSILNMNELWKGNFELIIYYASSYEKVFSKKDIESSYLKKVAEVRKSKTWDLDEKLASLSVDTFFKKGKETQKLVEKWSQKAEKEAKGHFERQSAMSTAIWLLKKSGQTNKAMALAKSEIKKSESPFYFMSYLGGMLIQEKRHVEALNWYRKAWEDSKGHATRFQWGTSYLQKLIKHTPEKTKEIKETSEKLMGELIKDSDAFMGRNKKRLERISTSYKDWESKYSKELSSLKGSLKDLCSKTSQTTVKDQCLKWLKAF